MVPALHLNFYGVLKIKKKKKILGLFSLLTTHTRKERLGESKAFTHLANFLVLRANSHGLSCVRSHFLASGFPTEYREFTYSSNHIMFQLEGSRVALFGWDKIGPETWSDFPSHTASSPDTTLSQWGQMFPRGEHKARWRAVADSCEHLRFGTFSPAGVRVGDGRINTPWPWRNLVTSFPVCFG